MNEGVSLAAAVSLLLVCTAATFGVAVASADGGEAKPSFQDVDEIADTVDDERSVTLNGDEERNITIAEGPNELIDLTVDVDDRNVSIRNPGDVDVVVTVTDETGEEGTVRIAADETVSGELERGDYVLTAEAAERSVTLNGERELALTSSEDVQSLTVAVENGTVSFFNPNDEHVSVTVLSDDEHVITFDAHPGGERSGEFETGIYTLFAATQDNETVPVNYETETDILVNPNAINLGSIVSDQNVSIENPSDENAMVTVTDEMGAEQTVEIPAGENVSGQLAPGNYTMIGGADDLPVLLNGQQQLAFTIDEEPPEPVDLDVTVSDQIVILENPTDTDVTVTVTDEAGTERTVDAPGGGSVVEVFAPGQYTLTAELRATDA